MRRTAPRPLSAALTDAVAGARPAGLLAAVQSAWPQVAGAALADAATPVSESGGTVTVAAESGIWAQELDLLSGDLKLGLNDALEAAGETARVERFRFVVGSASNRG